MTSEATTLLEAARSRVTSAKAWVSSAKKQERTLDRMAAHEVLAESVVGELRSQLDPISTRQNHRGHLDGIVVSSSETEGGMCPLSDLVGFRLRNNKNETVYRAQLFRLRRRNILLVSFIAVCLFYSFDICISISPIRLMKQARMNYLQMQHLRMIRSASERLEVNAGLTMSLLKVT